MSTFFLFQTDVLIVFCIIRIKSASNAKSNAVIVCKSLIRLGHRILKGGGGGGKGLELTWDGVKNCAISHP